MSTSGFESIKFSGLDFPKHELILKGTRFWQNENFIAAVNPEDWKGRQRRLGKKSRTQHPRENCV